MAYVKKGIVTRRRGRRGMSGLGGASDCSPTQNFYPNLTFAGVTGQCSTPAEAAAALKSGSATGNLNGASGGTYTGGGSGISDLIKWGASLFGSAVAPTPTPAAPTVVAPSGMSTTTKIALAGGAVLLVAFVATR